MEHRIGVISDTHIPRFQYPFAAVEKYFVDVELIIHAGDLSTLSVIDKLEAIAPVIAVQGNVEGEDVVMALPIKREVLIGQCRIGIVHNLGDARYFERNAKQEFPNARVVVFGHSHSPYNREHNGQLLFNSGSATDRRRQPTRSLGLLTINDETHSVYGEIIALSA